MSIARILVALRIFVPRFSLTAWVCHAVDVFFADWVCLAAGIFILLLGGLLFSAQTVFDTT